MCSTPCDADADCHNANYVCDKGKCKDPLRSCRDTVVILFTDGGESANNDYDSPWVQAKRMSIGLGCDSDADCVGGATCQSVQQCANSNSSDLADGTPMPVHFLLLRIQLSQVEQLDLGSQPHRRTLWRQATDWSAEPLNP